MPPANAAIMTSVLPVGLKSLIKFSQGFQFPKLSEDGFLCLDDWVCPKCIVTARLLRPNSPLFDAIATIKSIWSDADWPIKFSIGYPSVYSC